MQESAARIKESGSKSPRRSFFFYTLGRMVADHALRWRPGVSSRRVPPGTIGAAMAKKCSDATMRSSESSSASAVLGAGAAAELPQLCRRQATGDAGAAAELSQLCRRQATGEAKNVQDQDQVGVVERGHGQNVVGREYVSLSDGPRHTAPA